MWRFDIFDDRNAIVRFSTRGFYTYARTGECVQPGLLVFNLAHSSVVDGLRRD